MTQFVDETEAMVAVDGFTAAWLARDMPRMATFLTDDFVFWNNCSRTELGKPGAVGQFERLGAVLRDTRYHDVRRQLTPVGLVQQHLASFDTPQGSFRDIPEMWVFTTRGSQIARCDCYLDSTGLPTEARPDGAMFL